MSSPPPNPFPPLPIELLPPYRELLARFLERNSPPPPPKPEPKPPLRP